MNLWFPGMDMYIQLYLKLLASQDLLYRRRNSAQCYMAAWVGGEFGGEWVYVYVCLSPFAVHLKISQNRLSAILQYKKEFKFFFKKYVTVCVQSVYANNSSC